MLARPHQQASRSHVYSAVSTDSSVDRAPRQQHQYFEKQRQWRERCHIRVDGRGTNL